MTMGFPFTSTPPSRGSAIGAPVSGGFEVVDVLKINNTVSATGPGAATHKMTINVGGTDYYIALTAV